MKWGQATVFKNPYVMTSGEWFDVQDARMSRGHGCTGATFCLLFFEEK